ncbi:LPS-assembly protein LptD [Lichenicoccus sp.]|uniref:LPS-assembly protein LptD n=1 Tax=Lichenicoccus sp. TaxID=2781899 RepID=UPI003D13B729
MRGRIAASGFAVWALSAASPPALAQSALTGLSGGKGAPVSRSAPVTFEADRVSYDNAHNLVTWSGHVEIWQNDHVLRADEVTFDRNTGVAAARGNVAIIEPDGQVLFAQYAELTQGMREMVMDNMRAILANNGKLAANGARRTDGKVNVMSKSVYTACKICAAHPDQPPFWEIKSYKATQDLEHKRIEYQDSTLNFFGFPVGYLPYFSVPDPSVRRQSGFLLGDISPHDKHLGTYVTLPYYWVINDRSDATFIPLIASATGPQLTSQYRQFFNEGRFRITGAIADDTHGPYVSAAEPQGPGRVGVSGFVFANADFNWNDNWHYGADVNVASSSDYMRDYRIPGYGNDILTSVGYIEGFGVGAYSRLDAIGFQGLNTGAINQSQLPFVLPRYQYNFFGQPDLLGGRFSLSTNDFNVYRPDGTSDERASLVLNYDRPLKGPLGQLWVLTLHLDSETYNAHKLDLAPNYSTVNAASTAQALPTVALKMNWPFVRALHNSSQIIEPIVQLIAAPNAGNSVNDHIPNEDSLAYEFTDTTLFQLNRHEGIDRLDGGLRANVGLHANWTFGSQQIDALVGQSYQEHIDRNQVPDSGLTTHASDIVGRLSFTPADWIDFTARGRFDHATGQTHFADGLISAGNTLLRVSGGYIYNSHDIYYYYDSNYRTGHVDPLYFLPTNEATLGVSSQFRQYRLSAFGRRDLATNRLVAVGADGAYENDCFIFDLSFIRRYTTINGDGGDTSILFTLTFKTIGSFPVNG